MARGSLRRRFLISSIASTLVALALFAGGAAAVIVLDTDAETDIRERKDSYGAEAAEMIVGAMVVAAPLGLLAAVSMAVLMSRRSVRPLEDAIRAARETTAQDLRRSLPVPERDDEIRDLVVALNDLFVRLDDGFGALARFAADASHELRTPLAVMATELEVALRHPRTNSEWEATGRASLDELRRISDLVEGLLTLARAGADAPASRRTVQLVECVDAVLSQLATRAEAAGISLVAPVEGSSHAVAANAVMIETAIRNLVHNAIAATPRGGEVKLTIEDGATESSIIVDDNGPGLGANPEALFAPFQRGKGATADSSERGAGVGLGLAIARRIAVAHGGRLVPSTSPLGGARFTLSIPYA